jgi:hypothetical protein
MDSSHPVLQLLVGRYSQIVCFQTAAVAQRWLRHSRVSRGKWADFMWAIQPVAAAKRSVLSGGMLELLCACYQAASMKKSFICARGGLNVLQDPHAPAHGHLS